jgi:hypothetical protein
MKLKTHSGYPSLKYLTLGVMLKLTIRDSNIHTYVGNNFLREILRIPSHWAKCIKTLFCVIFTLYNCIICLTQCKDINSSTLVRCLGPRLAYPSGVTYSATLKGCGTLPANFRPVACIINV